MALKRTTKINYNTIYLNLTNKVQAMPPHRPIYRKYKTPHAI